MLVQLWDYGWLARDRVALLRAALDTELIEHYIASPAFHTSFLPNDKDDTGLHGPFLAERISVDDFAPLQEDELGPYLESVELSDTPSVDAAERAKVWTHLKAAFRGDRRCYLLRRDERDRELFHEWGSVLFVFSEFLFVGPERDSVERFVIGYD